MSKLSGVCCQCQQMVPCRRDVDGLIVTVSHDYCGQLCESNLTPQVAFVNGVQVSAEDLEETPEIIFQGDLTSRNPAVR